MNWTRGLFRLWLLVSIPWIIYVVVDERMTATSGCESARYYASHPEPSDHKSAFRSMMEEAYRESGEQYHPPLLTPAEHYAIGEQICRMSFQAATRDIAIKAPMVPVGLILGAAVIVIVGATLVWVARGFQRKDA